MWQYRVSQILLQFKAGATRYDDTECERKSGVMDSSKVLGLSTWEVGVAIHRDGGDSARSSLRDGSNNGNSVADTLSLRCLGLPWRSSGLDSALPLQGAWV